MKLNLGCGDIILQDYVNLDIRRKGEIQGSALFLPFREGAFSEVLASDIIEHFTPPDAELVVSEISRVLEGSGRVLVRLPSLRAIFKKYAEGEKAELVSWWLFGAQTYPENFHYAVYDEESIQRLFSAFSGDVYEEGTNMVFKGVKK